MKQLLLKVRGLTAKSRLYIRGHGDWQNQRVGGLSGKFLADLLRDDLPDDLLISITSCQAGRDKGSAATHRVMCSIDSFAAEFHKRLNEPKRQCKVRVYARVFTVKVSKAGRKLTTDAAGDFGKVPHRARSKILFYWSAENQMRKWVDYDKKDDPDKWEDVDQYAVINLLV
jgi:hypothetical protein